MIIGENIKYFNLGSIRFKLIEFDVPKSIDTNTCNKHFLNSLSDNRINFSDICQNIDRHLLSNMYFLITNDFIFRYPIKILEEHPWGTVTPSYIQGWP